MQADRNSHAASEPIQREGRPFRHTTCNWAISIYMHCLCKMWIKRRQKDMLTRLWTSALLARSRSSITFFRALRASLSSSFCHWGMTAVARLCRRKKRLKWEPGLMSHPTCRAPISASTALDLLQKNCDHCIQGQNLALELKSSAFIQNKQVLGLMVPCK